MEADCYRHPKIARFFLHVTRSKNLNINQVKDVHDYTVFFGRYALSRLSSSPHLFTQA
ncbi:hypothetical protein SAMN05661012_05455 [Chitinophaga sancti]|uniref:Uncharacterized protein n=1 Tax=Chitinophaga sancti TaxID=1004 RepID=A0A1K1SIW2_9BACT|nr:hypothetical protein SAMN05661012_05455 [Chitinophaga sancti]